MLFYFSLLRLIIEFQFKELNYEENQLSFRLQSKKSLNDRGTALVQVEAYLNKRKCIFYACLFTARTMGCKKKDY